MTTKTALAIIEESKDAISKADAALLPLENELRTVLTYNLPESEHIKYTTPAGVRALMIGRLIDFWLVPLYNGPASPDKTSDLNHLDHLIALADALEIALEVVRRQRPDLLAAAMLRQTNAPTV